MSSMKTLGLRHVALNVKDAQLSKKFYMTVLKMKSEWEPDPKSVYLTSDQQDNLALHQADALLHRPGALNHIGFFVLTLNEVDDWYAHVKTLLPGYNAKIVKEIKTHRDGARSFYFDDPDGNIIQLLYHPPISQRMSEQQT